VRIPALLALALLAGPPASEVAEPIAGAIAIEWLGEEPDAAARLDLRERVATLDGRPLALVQDRALARARVAVSREVPRETIDVHRGLRRELDGADQAFRAGDFAEAEQALARVLASLEQHPQLPGAASMAREARLLEALLAWSAGRRDAAEQALALALVLDPEALLSTRRAPPELVEAYRVRQTELLAVRAGGWVEPRVEIEGGEAVELEIELEIDGVLGSRPVPPGRHFLVAYVPGREPVAALHEVGETWTIVPGVERIAAHEVDTHARAEALCEVLGVEVLVLALQRDERVGVQAHRCGQGFGPRWIGAPEQLGSGLQTMLGGGFAGESATLADAWPAPTLAPVEPPPRVDTPPRKPWYRKGWVWGTSVGALALVGGAIATGVVLSSSPASPRIEVDADDFIAR
jgi:hypothetical protein